MRRRLLMICALALASMAAGCGSQGIELAKDDPLYPGAYLFQQRCAGCHTFKPAGGDGSATNVNSRERKDGPSFDVRAVQYDEVLYAIRNGGFSSGPMPQNIVVGEDAEKVACFVAKYAGREAERSETPGTDPPSGTGPDECKPE
jgi:mono/diheme cytochrome c family protein